MNNERDMARQMLALRAESERKQFGAGIILHREIDRETAAAAHFALEYLLRNNPEAVHNVNFTMAIAVLDATFELTRQASANAARIEAFLASRNRARPASPEARNTRPRQKEADDPAVKSSGKSPARPDAKRRRSK